MAKTKSTASVGGPMVPAFETPLVQLYLSHCLAGLRQLPDRSVHTVVTSPPYFGLRQYATKPQVWGGDSDCSHEWMSERYYREGGAKDSSKEHFHPPGEENAQRIKETRWREDIVCSLCGAWQGELGQEPTPQMFIQHLVEIFSEVWRVLRNDGTVWINIADSYSTDGKWGGSTGGKHAKGLHDSDKHRHEIGRGKRNTGVRNKSLLLIPQRLAIALLDAGWIVRSEVVWHKGNCMPESVTDRPTRSHETIWLLTKQPRYYYDAIAIQEQSVSNHGSGNGFKRAARQSYQDKNGPRGSDRPWKTVAYRNCRDVWQINSVPYRKAHFACFPPKIPKLAVLASTSAVGCCPACGSPWQRITQSTGKQQFGGGGGSKTADAPGAVLSPTSSIRTKLVATVETMGWKPTCRCPDHAPVPCTVLDPFAGSGTTLAVAQSLGRKAIGLELNPNYLELIEERCQQLPLHLQCAIR